MAQSGNTSELLIRPVLRVMIQDMDTWNVSFLKGADVWIKVAGTGEARGTIDSIKTPYESPDRGKAVNYSIFNVELENGIIIECPGDAFSRIASNA